jgi:enoyl-CoA hydratase
MELALTGEPLLAERAAELGLVSRVAEPGRALDVALELAALIAANGPLAVAAAKRVVAAAADHGEAELWALQDAVLDPVMTSGDALEGARAVAEKRPPRWRGE